MSYGVTAYDELPDTPYERAYALQSLVIAMATSGPFDDDLYVKLRSEFLATDCRELMPSFVRSCRDSGQLWAHLKRVATGSGSYAIRSDYVYEAFQPMLDYLEQGNSVPADKVISETLSSFDSDGVHRVWQRALERRHEDPEGAITIARTLLETVCKRILDEAQQPYGEDDLPKLYGSTAKLLNLAPSQHTETAFKAILGGCHSVVQNLGTLRNKIGDAHGKGKNPVRAAPRHAALAVNLAGSMATFLVETWLAQEGRRT